MFPYWLTRASLSALLETAFADPVAQKSTTTRRNMAGQDSFETSGVKVSKMARLLSVNVGLPRDIEWKGRTVHTGIWKNPVPGRCRVGRSNLDGDGQGDLAGHGGEQRAVFEIVKVGEAKERMTVAEINALLYSPYHPRDRLERALRIEALSPGWRW